MNNSITLLFSFYAVNSQRRSYISACLKCINEGLLKQKNNQFKILALDWSPKKESAKNIKVFFSKISNLKIEYINDETPHLIDRINNHLNKINSRYVLRLLEDCIFRTINLVNGLTNIVISWLHYQDLQ